MSELYSLAEIVARMRAAGKPIPRGWGHIRGNDLSDCADVVEFTRGMVDEQLMTLCREIAAVRKVVAVRHELPLERVMPA
jgi:hypothetical protein